MSILTVVQEVALAVALSRPTAVFASTEREWQEMQSVANEAAAVIVDAFDWQKLQRSAVLTGDGNAEDFNLPADFGRMLKSSDLWSSRFGWDMMHVVELNEWIGMEMWPISPVSGAWIIFANQFHVRPVMGVSETAKFAYITNEIATGKTRFSDDADVFLLDERLLKLCMIYLWKQRKKQDFAAELADYEEAAFKAFDKDGGSKPVVSGNRAPGRAWRQGNVWPGVITQ